MHSTWSDGGAPIERMAATAMAIGHEYMVQTDHSARLTIAHGLNEQRLSEQLDQIDVVNAAIADAGHDFRILSGMEVDILEDGALDLSTRCSPASTWWSRAFTRSCGWSSSR